MTNVAPAHRPHLVVVTGPVGAGKSTTARAVVEELERRGEPGALIDMDYLRWLRPSFPDDRFNSRLGLANLAVMGSNFCEAGARWLVLADVVEHPDDAHLYGDAVPGSVVTVVRLNVPLDLVLTRLEGRESAESMPWYRHRAPELQGIMERTGVGDLVVHVGDRAPDAVAREILAHLLP